MLYYIVTNLNEVITTKQYIDSVLNDNVNGLFFVNFPQDTEKLTQSQIVCENTPQILITQENNIPYNPQQKSSGRRFKKSI